MLGVSVASQASPDRAEPAEEDPLVVEAKAAAEASRLRLEAERLRTEVSQAEQASAATLGDSSGTQVPQEGAAPVAAQVASPAVEPPMDAGGSEADKTAARLIVSTNELRNAAKVLLQLHRSEGGQAALEALVTRACDALRTGGRCEDAFGSDAAPWDRAGVSLETAKRDVCKAFQLFATDGSLRYAQDTAGGGTRAAIIEMLIYDQLPDEFAAFAEILDAVENKKDPEEGGDNVVLDPGMVADLKPSEKEAARISARFEAISSEDERNRARLQRLLEYPLVKEVTALVNRDAELAEFREATKPHHLRLYVAAREASFRARPSSDRKGAEVISVKVSGLQIIGALIVTIALAFFTASTVTQSMKDNAAQQGLDPQGLPMYSLNKAGKS